MCSCAADGSDDSFYSGKIVECSWNSETNVWVCMRVRTDKSTPNDFNTYKKVSVHTLYYILFHFLFDLTTH